MQNFSRTVWTALVRFLHHDGHVYCSHIAYTVLLAFFPFLAFVATLAAFIGSPEAARQFADFVLGYIPRQIGDTLAPIIDEVLARKRGGLLAISLAASMWIASSGVEALRTALNLAFGASEMRPIWFTRLHALMIVLVGSGVILAANFIFVIGSLLWPTFASLFKWTADTWWLWQLGRHALGAVPMFIVICLFYRWLPGRNPIWRHILRGALFATVLWLAFASLFAVFLRHAVDYSVFYGGIGGIVATLAFLYLSAATFVLGAEVGGLLQDRAPLQSPKLAKKSGPPDQNSFDDN